MNKCFSLFFSPFVFWLELIRAQHVAAASLCESVCSPTARAFFNIEMIRECWEIRTRLWVQKAILWTITKTVWFLDTNAKLKTALVYYHITIFLKYFMFILPVHLLDMRKKYRKNSPRHLLVSEHFLDRRYDRIRLLKISAKISFGLIAVSI